MSPTCMQHSFQIRRQYICSFPDLKKAGATEHELMEPGDESAPSATEHELMEPGGESASSATEHELMELGGESASSATEH